MKARARRWYADPKIAEAVFAITASGTPTSAWHDEVFARMAARFVGFASAEEVVPVGEPLARRRASPPILDRGPVGAMRVIKRNQDATRAVQYGPGTCAYNVYPPYGHYEDHLPTFERLFEEFLAEEQPYMIGSAEQRFVNELWLSRADRPSDLFTFYPPLGELETSHVPMRLEVETASSGDVAVTVSLARGGEGDGVLYVLEIAARATRALPAEVGALVEWHNRAHHACDDSFEAAITDETRRRLRQV
ncbi:MAG TPA: TIGR04255 family protein [Kofleriaceae bacterium]|nr:TIGR04255 family protein [Kofleriaceae bacterium]